MTQRHSSGLSSNDDAQGMRLVRPRRQAGGGCEFRGLGSRGGDVLAPMVLVAYSDVALHYVVVTIWILESEQFLYS